MRGIEPVLFLAAAIGMIPALVVLPLGRMLRQMDVVAAYHQFDMVE